MVHTELDQPDDVEVRCRICGETLKARYFWVYDRWLRPSVHDRCADKVQARMEEGPRVEREIPDRFRQFDTKRCNQRALADAQAFDPDSRLKTLAIMGVPGRGKSRLAWAIAGQFFDMLYESTGSQKWLDYFSFEQLMSEFDRFTINRIAASKFAFIDDLGCIESSGREKFLLQSAIRTRVKTSRWTILTIDDMSFDPELKDVLVDRARIVVVS